MCQIRGWTTFERDQQYPPAVRCGVPRQPNPVTRENLVKAIASFERAIVSARSPYDRYHFERDDAAISDAAKRGEVLFHSRPLSCFTCHGGIHFSGAMGAEPRSMAVEFHNTGLYNLAGARSYPAGNLGLYDQTNEPKDVGKFKAPTLRNIAVTAPYMHDGSVATLEDAIDHYAAGGRTIPDGPYRGVGRDNPNKSPAIRGFTLTDGQRADLVAFLRSLTDEDLLRDPRFANPWAGAGSRVGREAGRTSPCHPRRPITLAAVLLLCAVEPIRGTKRLTIVAAASDLRFALTESIAERFDAESGATRSSWCLDRPARSTRQIHGRCAVRAVSRGRRGVSWRRWPVPG